jgi:hypothetical protein
MSKYGTYHSAKISGVIPLIDLMLYLPTQNASLRVLFLLMQCQHKPSHGRNSLFVIIIFWAGLSPDDCKNPLPRFVVVAVVTMTTRQRGFSE